MKLRTVSSSFLLRRDRHQVAAIYEGSMNSQFTYVDANNSYVVARSPYEHTLSVNPSFVNYTSNYVQGPIQSNLHVSTSYDTSNMHHMYSNSHASATPEIHRPMNNMMSLVNKVETPHVGTYNNMNKVFHLFIHRHLTCNMSLAQNKRISALCLEQHKKGLFPDYEAIRARVL